VKQERKKKKAPEGEGTRPRRDKGPHVSLLIPVWNEKETLPSLYERTRKTLEGMGCSWEILFVDDGSTDGSEAFLRAFHTEDPRVRVLFLARNFGQHAALCAGFEQVRGDVVVIMDGDLQLNPEDIPSLVDKVREGYDLVGGWRIHRVDSSLRRKIPSWLFNQVLGRATGVRLKDFNCGFKAMNRRIAERVGEQGEQRLYLAPLLVDLAESVTEIPVSHHPRAAGSSKYTLARSVALIMRYLRIRLRGSLRGLDLPAGPVGRGLDAARGSFLGSGSPDSGAPLFVVRERLPGD
jgi:glycosyltransferase involved in cell wall biosynthesis